jgi:phage protein D
MSAFAFTLLFGPGPVPVPAPPEVVDAVQEIDVDSTVDEASVFHLRLAIAQATLGDWTLLDKDFFRPLAPVSIRITNGLGFPETLINGYVSRQEVNYSLEPGASILDVTGMDATLLMNLHENIQRWPNQPDGLIATAIFGKYALLPRVQQTSPQFVEPQGTSTQRRTDIRLLRWMAERNGFECYVQPEPLTGIDMGFFQPPELSGPPSAVLNVNLGPETNVVDFSIGYEMAAPTSVAASSIDVFTKSVQQASAPAAVEVPLGAEPALQRLLSTPLVRPAGTGLMRTAELQTFAQAITDRSSFAITAQGTVSLSAGILRPGSLVNVRGVGRLFNGSYYVTRVTHSITRAGYTQRFQGRRNAVTMTGTELYAGI